MAQAKKKTVKKATAKTKKAATRKTAKKTVATKRKSPAKAAAKTGAVAATTLTKDTTQTMEKVMTQGKTQFDKLTNDATKASKEQIDVVMKSGNIFMKGFEDIAKAYMGLAQTSAEKNTQAVKAMLSCKTINEYTETSNKWVQQNFDDFIASATKLSELSVKIATDAFEPINDQFGKSVKKAADSLAA